MKIAISTGIKGMGIRHHGFTTFEEIEKRDDKDKARIIISKLKEKGICVLPIKGSVEAIYYEVITES
ncbi:hypothetical protein [Paenibacillus sp. FSL H3-0469]|uniref:hypothetical protein n=1 Tax=Paenibacillus sp. FSL H3-0469 TaxID=2954506 RepID=UPI0031011766